MTSIERVTNREIANLLREIAAAYEIKGNDRFRQVAYQRAADAVDHAGSDIKDTWENGQLEEVPGIGKTIAGHLDEYFRKGRVGHFEQIKKSLPKGMFTLLGVPGVGPKSAYKIAKELKINTIEELKKAAVAGKIAMIPGFGKRSEEELLEGIAETERRGNRVLLPIANEVAKEVLTLLKSVPGAFKTDVLGSLRRCVSTVGDIDIAVAARDPSKIIAALVSWPKVLRVLGKGEAKASVVLKTGYQIDLRVQEPDSYGAQLQYFTGSKEHNIHLRTWAKSRGFSLSEYGIKNLKDKNSSVKIYGTEEAFYKDLGMVWIPPELREDTGEIEAALQNRLPNLIESKDIKGDLHLHCNFPLEESHDPGVSSMEEIAEKARSLGYEYVALGNHSPSVSNHTPSQMKKLLIEKNNKIENLRPNYPDLKLLNVVEVDILSDGKLALSDECLKLLDLASVGVHSSLRQTKTQMTKRVTEALKNPYVHVLAHPTGRLLLEREGYDLDWDAVFRVCEENNKVLEINSYPSRLDLPDSLVRKAVSRGIKMMINTDAHEAAQMNLMPYGVSVARRGWAEKGDIINSLSWASLRAKLGLKDI